MFLIHITEKALEEICLEKYPNWHLIAQKQSKIVVNCDTDSSLYTDFENPIFLFGQMHGVEFESNKTYINNINEHPESVLKKPCGAFILDVDEQTAQEIEKKFGVICQSDSKIDDNVLTETKEFAPDRGDGGYGWAKVFSDIKRLPSNSLIMCDRNIFANDDIIKRNGVHNVTKIADAILPDTFGDTYHIAIVFDSLKTGIQFSQIASWTNKALKGIRQYPIIIEMVVIKRGCFQYDEIHNRRIITNYCIVRAEHKLSAFEETKSLCSQVINCDLLYSKGLRSTSDSPEKPHSQAINIFAKVVAYGKSTPSAGYEYAQNGNTKLQISAIQNRLML